MAQKLCKDCIYFQDIEHLNEDEGECIHPYHQICEILYWKENSPLKINRPIVKKNNYFCGLFEKT